MTWRQTGQEGKLDGETIEGEINKKITGNEKALSFGIYGNTGLPHGLWVRRFSGLWERCARENGCGRAEKRKMYEVWWLKNEGKGQTTGSKRTWLVTATTLNAGRFFLFWYRLLWYTWYWDSDISKFFSFFFGSIDSFCYICKRNGMEGNVILSLVQSINGG